MGVFMPSSFEPKACCESQDTHIGFGGFCAQGITMNKLIRVLLAAFFVAAVSITIAKGAGRRVAASDVIQIHVLNQPDLDTQARVAPDGTISVPYVGRFRAAGLTEDVIAARIRKALTSAGILK